MAGFLLLCHFPAATTTVKVLGPDWSSDKKFPNIEFPSHITIFLQWTWTGEQFVPKSQLWGYFCLGMHVTESAEWWWYWIEAFPKRSAPHKPILFFHHKVWNWVIGLSQTTLHHKLVVGIIPISIWASHQIQMECLWFLMPCVARKVGFPLSGSRITFFQRNAEMELGKSSWRLLTHF